MKLLFPALEQRFDADRALVVAARKLYNGFANVRVKAVLPYVEVYRQGGGQDDSFSKDIELYDLRFNLYGNQILTDQVQDMAEHMTRVFDDAPLAGPGFTIVMMNRSGGPVGPFVVDGVYQAFISYQATLQRVVNSPLVRSP